MEDTLRHLFSAVCANSNTFTSHLCRNLTLRSYFSEARLINEHTFVTPSILYFYARSQLFCNVTTMESERWKYHVQKLILLFYLNIFFVWEWTLSYKKLTQPLINVEPIKHTYLSTRYRIKAKVYTIRNHVASVIFLGYNTMSPSN